MKLAIINSHPIQYFAPLYRELSKMTSIELKVYYGSTFGIEETYDPQFGKKIRWDIPLLDGYSFEFLKNISINPGPGKSFWGINNPGIIRSLRRDKPDFVIIHGWAYFTYLVALIYCLFSGIKVLLRTETPLNQELQNISITGKIKRYILQYFVFPRIHSFLYIGKQNKNFYLHLGVPEHKLTFAPYSIDNKRFRTEYLKLKDQKFELRQKLGIPSDSLVFLFSGKFMAKKRPMDIIEATKKLGNPNVFVIFMGEGALRSEMEQLIKNYNLQAQFVLTGFKNQTELPEYFITSDIFILPSTIGETWGLVANEAMNFNLPIITSDAPGSAYDLVKENENGFVYPCGNIEALADKMGWFVENQEKIPEMGTKSGKIIEDYSYTEFVSAICKVA